MVRKGSKKVFQDFYPEEGGLKDTMLNFPFYRQCEERLGNLRRE